MSDSFEVRFLPGRKTARVGGGTSLFTAAHWARVLLDSTCGGLGTCGRCRVRIRGESSPPSAADREHLAAEELADGWRLACAAEVRGDMICEAPEIGEIPQTAVTGESGQVRVEPAVRRIELDPSDSREAAPDSDLEWLEGALDKQGLAVDTSLDCLRQLPEALRRTGSSIAAILVGPRLVSLESLQARISLLGVAFDVGTTTVVGTLVDLESGETLAVEADLNEQTMFGGDVISRIAHAMSGAEARGQMQQAIVRTLNRIVDRLCRSSGAERSHIFEAVVVGNCTMLHFLLGVDARSIAVAPFVPVFRASVDIAATAVGLQIHPRGRLETFPTLGAYVGADTVAGLHATGLARQDEVWLFIDIGTNSEIALGSSASAIATSAPAGPAFEGSCIGAGMAASAGAIDRVRLGRSVEVGVVGGGRPRGICGSGLIDTVAQLLEAGLVDSSGRLRAADEAVGHPLQAHLCERQGERAFALSPEVLLTQRDIRELQAAKSSVATGVRALLDHSGVEAEEIRQVLLAGSFGNAIDPWSARRLGLVPDLPIERLRFVGNAAAEGGRMALLSFRERQVAFDLARRVLYLELSSREDFNDLFLEELAFPQPAGSHR